MMDLFINTVHTVNARDYSPEQLDAWAPQDLDEEQWDRSFREHFALVAVQEGEIVGFGNIDSTGCLDRLYVGAAHTGCGIAAALCDRLEAHAKGPFTVHASITAKPFFEARGYRTVRQQTVERKGVKMTNFLMEKP
jgi:putative acetyltransferase